MDSCHRLLVALSALLFISMNAQARESRLKMKVSTSYDVVALSLEGTGTTADGGRVTVTPPANSFKLILVSSETNQAYGPVIAGIRSGNRIYTVSQARRKNLCTSSARAITIFRLNTRRRTESNALNLGTVTVGDGFGYLRRTLPSANFNRSDELAEVDTDCRPTGGGSLGVTAATGDSSLSRSRGRVSPLDDAPTEGGADEDDDGMPNAFDADDDGDGVLDNDDDDSSGSGSSSTDPRKFWVFSNYHSDMTEALNMSAMTITKSQVDALMRTNTGLAIQVVGAGTIADVELDCGSLPYCSAGGHGRGKEPYPAGLEFPEDVDTDSDGLGTLTAGSTGDFQLACFTDSPSGYAASDNIGAGDVYVQRYTSGSRTVQVPGMLNFVFHTNPAVKSVETGVRTYTVSYPVPAGDSGTSGNCFHVPTTGDVNVTLTVWRPQRKGITSAGEASFMDMGNLRLVTNIPNGPCSTGPGSPCETGPGLCASTVYSTSDPNLTVASDGLQDSLGDTPQSPANTFTYTINLSQCVQSAPGVSWDAGEYVRVPIQMMNVYGDNATQDICFIRDDS